MIGCPENDHFDDVDILLNADDNVGFNWGVMR
jgi:hypothetical protein